MKNAKNYNIKLIYNFIILINFHNYLILKHTSDKCILKKYKML